MSYLDLVTIEWVFMRDTCGAIGNSTPMSIPVGSKIIMGWVLIEENRRTLMDYGKGKCWLGANSRVIGNKLGCEGV